MKAKTQPPRKTCSPEIRNHSAELQKRLKGRVIGEDNPSYDRARRIWNGNIDRKPRLIAQCLDQGDVIACVQFARERELRLAVKGNGHAVAGTAICQDGLVVDLSMMKGVRVNPQERTAQSALRVAQVPLAVQGGGIACVGKEFGDGVFPGRQTGKPCPGNGTVKVPERTEYRVSFRRKR